MLLRGANAMGYTNYPDNAVQKFCKQASKSDVDIFCNCVNNLKLGNDNTGSAGGFMEGNLSYTGEYRTPTREITILSITSIWKERYLTWEFTLLP